MKCHGARIEKCYVINYNGAVYMHTARSSDGFSSSLNHNKNGTVLLPHCSLAIAELPLRSALTRTACDAYRPLKLVVFLQRCVAALDMRPSNSSPVDIERTQRTPALYCPIGFWLVLYDVTHDRLLCFGLMRIGLTAT
jgi:hypothetical protein